MSTPLIVILFIVYFLPTIIAVLRGRKNPGSTIVVNIFLGWTFIGWVIALAMSFGDTSVNNITINNTPPQDQNK